jgi:tubulin polyglutamylase TTLL1
MKIIATQAIKATSHQINPEQKMYGFELFGLDFIVDSEFKPWLIEFNTNPCLELSSPVLDRILPTMLENMFRIAVDPIFRPNEDSTKPKHFLYENCL